MRLSSLFGRPLGIAAAVCALLAPLAPAAAQTPYKVLNTWKVGGEGGWDYLLADPSAHRLYITHGKRLEVLDTNSGAVAGSMTDFGGLHGIALGDDPKIGYLSDGAANAVIVFDRISLTKLASIPVGGNPDGIIFEPTTKTIWALNGKTNDASVIDTASRKVIETVKLGGRPEFPTVDGKGTLFLNLEDANAIQRIDAKTRKITATWKLAGCESPSGMAIDTAGRRLFSVCDGKKMAVVSADSGKVIKLANIGDGPDAAGFDPQAQVAFSSNGEGTLSIVSTAGDDYKTEQLKTRPGARTMAFDSGNGHVYLVFAEMGPKPAPSPTNPRGRAQPIPGSFSVLVVGKQ